MQKIKNMTKKNYVKGSELYGVMKYIKTLINGIIPKNLHKKV